MLRLPVMLRLPSEGAGAARCDARTARATDHASGISGSTSCASCDKDSCQPT